MLYKYLLFLICMFSLQSYSCLWKKNKLFYFQLKNRTFSKNKYAYNKTIKYHSNCFIKNYRNLKLLYINKIKIYLNKRKEKKRKLYLKNCNKEYKHFKFRTNIYLYYKKNTAKIFYRISENHFNERKKAEKKVANKKYEDKELKEEFLTSEIKMNNEWKEQNKKNKIKKGESKARDFINGDSLNNNSILENIRRKNNLNKKREKDDKKEGEREIKREEMVEEKKHEERKEKEKKKEKKKDNKKGDEKEKNLYENVSYEKRNINILADENCSKNSVDFFINQHKDLLLKSKSKIMRMSAMHIKENIKNEASIDDILYGGFLNIYKPVNLYSMKVCEKVKNILKNYFSILNEKNINLKVGHGGTLDPFAEGILIIGIQKATKKLSDFLKCYKTYLALSIFGFETDTLDREGKIIEEKTIYVDKKAISENLKNFIGWKDQTPPIYSAKRVKGLRLYEYARKNISVHIKSNKVHIKDIEYLNEFDFPFFDLQICCSGGTYIRSLIRDFAHSLNTHATLIKLIRIQQNDFKSTNALHYDNLNIDSIKKYFIKL